MRHFCPQGTKESNCPSLLTSSSIFIIYRVAGQYILDVQEIMSLPVLVTSYVFVQDIKGYYIRVNERMVECT